MTKKRHTDPTMKSVTRITVRLSPYLHNERNNLTIATGMERSTIVRAALMSLIEQDNARCPDT
jgi:metal-responsive CopG/Arc/MetJ family transcriptional regulator